MMKMVLTYDDTEKIAKAYRRIDSLIEYIERYNRERDLPGRPSGALLEVRQLLGEVLYGE